MTKIITNKNLIIGVFFFFVIALLFYFIPYAHDDWAWGSQIGMERLHSFFQDYNGRWGGNLFILLLSRSRILKALLCSLIIILIIVFAKKLVNNKNKQLLYFGGLLLLITPITVLAQGVFWASGFTNYVIPVLLILIFLYLNKNIVQNGKSSLKNKYIFSMIILGFITSLFIENLTIYNICLAIFIIAYQFIRTKSFNLSNISYFIGSILGTILMFSNGAYHNIANNADNYRMIEQGNVITRAISSYFSDIYKYFFTNNLILNIIIGVLVIIISFIYYKKSNKNNKILILPLTIIVGYISYLLFTISIPGVNIFAVSKYKNIIEALLPIVYYISIFIVLMLELEDKMKKRKIIFLFFSIVLINAPLFIVNPIGPRCFFASYLFFVLIALELVDIIIAKYNIDLTKILMPACISFLIFYLMVFGYMYKIETVRNNEINKSNDIKLTLPKLPYENYIWHANPAAEVFEYRFKLFYHIDQNKKVEFVDYKNFKNNH